MWIPGEQDIRRKGEQDNSRAVERISEGISCQLPVARGKSEWSEKSQPT